MLKASQQLLSDVHYTCPQSLNADFLLRPPSSLGKSGAFGTERQVSGNQGASGTDSKLIKFNRTRLVGRSSCYVCASMPMASAPRQNLRGKPGQSGWASARYCSFAMNELLYGHVVRLFSLIRMRATTFFALVAWLKRNTNIGKVESNPKFYLYFFQHPRRDRRHAAERAPSRRTCWSPATSMTVLYIYIYIYCPGGKVQPTTGSVFVSALTRGLVIPNGWLQLPADVGYNSSQRAACALPGRPVSSPGKREGRPAPYDLQELWNPA
ncbi:hypothetical protein B0T26DRAFT_713261 [Lasiosphaeria miniovina]|uniref:Uncharacterized protein n=1 Tax=Lasiosphaeria miniovina TaxID=1954250 RepID=A0AA40AMG2_9PEZI|nr:uncharacterized protein B0T26DRAFT_713261 [Lasiosphaeria miniovina]KAK0718422.1 hypothetical protein B0T26DRAFT_713261 [Lasiosphaeria miniovina]